MKYNKNIIETTFIKRPNRFQGYVNLNNEELLVHVPNTGRCKEILIPGCKVLLLLREEVNPNRKTKYDLIAGYKDNKLINIDSQIPNKVVLEALQNKKINKLISYTNILREKTFGNSRFDFKLSDNLGNEYYLEVKGVTLEDGGKCRFPDAPTERGRKHLLELIDVKEKGMGAGVLFLIQMEQAKEFSPNDETDSKFAEALRLAHGKGVDIFAYRCKVTTEEITLIDEVKVFL